MTIVCERMSLAMFRCWTSAKWDGFGNREIRLVSADSTGDNKAETSRRTNIRSGTGYGGRSVPLASI